MKKSKQQIAAAMQIAREQVRTCLICGLPVHQFLILRLGGRAAIRGQRAEGFTFAGLCASCSENKAAVDAAVNMLAQQSGAPGQAHMVHADGRLETCIQAGGLVVEEN